jgi:hypothetical protein
VVVRFVSLHFWSKWAKGVFKPIHPSFFQSTTQLLYFLPITTGEENYLKINT